MAAPLRKTRSAFGLAKFALPFAAVLMGGAGAAPASAQPATPFPVHHGVNVAGAYAHTYRLPHSHPDGQVSDYVTAAKEPPAYSPADLKAAGLDFVRFVVNPAPMLENPPTVRERLFSETEAGFQPYLAQGLRVIFDLHFWSPAHPVYTNEAVTKGSAAPFAQYKVLVTEVAKRLAKYPNGQVALDILNEPDNRVCSVQGWLRLQGELVKAVRQVAPKLPVLVTGCNDLLDATAAINAGNTDLADPNLLFTFHYYDPVLFTVQGQGVGNYRFLRAIPYPVSAGGEEDARGQTFAAIDDAHLSIVDNAAAKLWSAKQIHDYFINAWGADYISRRLDFMVQWARSNGIPPARLIIGEFGAQNERHGASPAELKQRIYWDEQVQAAADARGLASAYWMLSTVRGPIFH